MVPDRETTEEKFKINLAFCQGRTGSDLQSCGDRQGLSRRTKQLEFGGQSAEEKEAPQRKTSGNLPKDPPNS